jgi:hypothetical protein
MSILNNSNKNLEEFLNEGLAGTIGRHAGQLVRSGIDLAKTKKFWKGTAAVVPTLMAGGWAKGRYDDRQDTKLMNRNADLSGIYNTCHRKYGRNTPEYKQCINWMKSTRKTTFTQDVVDRAKGLANRGKDMVDSYLNKG